MALGRVLRGGDERDALLVFAPLADRGGSAGAAPGGRCCAPAWARRARASPPRAELAVDAPAPLRWLVCGGVDPELRAGDVVLRDGAAARRRRRRSPVPGRRSSRSAPARRGLRVHVGPILSSTTIVGAASGRADATAACSPSTWSRPGSRGGATVGRSRSCGWSSTPPAATCSTRARRRGELRALRSLRRAAPRSTSGRAPSARAACCSPGPRSFCAGVERAIEIVERALEQLRRRRSTSQADRPQRPVVADLERRGAVFVEELDEVPDGATVVFSAHGVSPAVRRTRRRGGST